MNPGMIQQRPGGMMQQMGPPLGAPMGAQLGAQLGAPPMAPGGGMMVKEMSQRVHDLDQRLTLTEHANRAALDEVYGLRDSIRNELQNTSEISKQARSNGDNIAGANVRLRRCEDAIEECQRKTEDLQSVVNRVEGQFLRTEGDKRLGSESATREARDARNRCDELSKIVDRQTRITDALSHEMATLRGRVEIKDYRNESISRKSHENMSNYDDVYQTVKPNVSHSSAADIAFQVRQETDRLGSMLRSAFDAKLSEAVKMINDLQARVFKKTRYDLTRLD